MKIDFPIPTQYDQLRKLWQDAFGDDEIFVDGFFCTGFAPLAAGEHFSALLKQRDNIFFDVSLGESQLTGIPARNVSTAGMEKLCFGSLSPFEYMESALINLEYAPDYDPQQIKTNAARAFRCLR